MAGFLSPLVYFPADSLRGIFCPIGKFLELPYWTKTLRGCTCRAKGNGLLAQTRGSARIPQSGILFYLREDGIHGARHRELSKRQGIVKLQKVLTMTAR